MSLIRITGSQLYAVRVRPSLRARRAYSRRQLLANAAIAASRVGSWPCAARITVAAEWPLAHIQKPIR